MDIDSLQKDFEGIDLESEEEEEKKTCEEEDEDYDFEPQEFIFLIDRSGSMYWGDSAITMAKQALKIFMHSLPEGSKFNICGFGSNHEFLFSESMEYNQ